MIVEVVSEMTVIYQENRLQAIAAIINAKQISPYSLSLASEIVAVTESV
jgi:hypothetical protein